MMRNFAMLLLMIMLAGAAHGQTTFVETSSVPVTENGNVLPKAWTGGLDCPMYQSIDMNNDGVKDLFVFDHKTDRVLTFINNNQASVSYTFDPYYATLFPALHDWAKLYDYDCDGDEDLFTHGAGYIACYRNNGTNPLSFTLVTPIIKSFYHFGVTFFETNIYVSAVNIPSFVDMDNDGDMDILSFPLGASYVEYHRNYSMDSTGLCGGFRFYNMRQCWGYFALSASVNKAVLPPASISSSVCPAYPATYPKPSVGADTLRHAGNILEAIDMDADGDKDLLIGDIVGRNLLYLQNGGTSDSAYMIYQDTLFPVYDIPALLDFVAAPYINDLDNDGRKDLLVANLNADLFQGAGENYYTTMLYRNVSSVPNAYQFEFVKNSFFNEEMVDVGTGAHPVFADVDADGKTDLLIGNDFTYYTGGARISQLAYYRNVSPAPQTPAYELITKDYAGLSAYNFTGLYPTFGDIDNDGDLDMFCGNTNSTLTLFRNTAGAGMPINLVLDSLNYQGISIGFSGMQSMPQLYDLDKDSRLDLIIGKRTGELSYYRNAGGTTYPVYTKVTDSLGAVDVHDQSTLLGYSTPLFYDSAGVTLLLVGSYSGYIYKYSNIDGNLAGTFTLDDSQYGHIYEPKSSAPALHDINGDGMMDLVVGNMAGGIKCFMQQIVAAEELLPDPSFEYYPNPAVNSLIVDFKSAVIREIRIFDVLGNIIMKKNVTGTRTVLNTESLKTGTYLLTVSDRGKVISRKLMISK